MRQIRNQKLRKVNAVREPRLKRVHLTRWTALKAGVFHVQGKRRVYRAGRYRLTRGKQPKLFASVFFRRRYRRARLDYRGYRRVLHRKRPFRPVWRRRSTRRYRRRGGYRAVRRPGLTFLLCRRGPLYYTVPTGRGGTGRVDLCLVSKKNNFWGVLYEGTRLSRVVSAGQLPGTSGSRRGTTYAAGQVSRKLGFHLNELAKLLPPAGGRPYRGALTGEDWLQKYDTWRKRHRNRPRIKMEFKLKNWRFSKRWTNVLKELVTGFVGYVRLNIKVTFQKYRPHNGLRPPKPTRK